MKQQVAALLASERYDCAVCDFLFPAPNVPNISQTVLFQHNVEAVIWKRHASYARNPVSRAYLSLQASRMERYERAICQAARHVVAVSEVDREIFERSYGARSVSSVPTGVDLEYFTPRERAEPKVALVFQGSMDWLPNIDGARFFIEQIYPHIRSELPDCKVAFAGRRPDPSLLKAVKRHPNLIVTGTVEDIRPWLWGAALSVVPLRIGGGTRLKIYEAMAARVPVISTSIGSEGLPVENGRHLVIEDEPRLFAETCVRLLRDETRRNELAEAAWNLVAGTFSWDAVARQFEAILSAHALRGNRPGLVMANEQS
jgi:glycosyltransferase involved in cell wall biosynthesis